VGAGGRGKGNLTQTQVLYLLNHLSAQWPKCCSGFLESSAISLQHPDCSHFEPGYWSPQEILGLPPATGSSESVGVRLSQPHATISDEGWAYLGGLLLCFDITPKLAVAFHSLPLSSWKMVSQASGCLSNLLPHRCVLDAVNSLHL